MSNLAFRFLTAAVAVPVILGILYLGPFLAYAALVGAAMVIAALEFFAFTHPGDRTGQYVGTALTAALYAVLVGTRYGETHGFLAILACVSVAPVALLFSLGRPSEIPNALNRTAAMVMGPIYIGAAMATLALIRTVGERNQGAGLVVMTLAIAWLSDTFAYFFGKGLGGPKLYPAVSPNKTWSGGVGGVVGSMTAAVVTSLVLVPALPPVPAVVVAAVAGAYGQAGDFCESALKRSAGIKDSGGILPGHGGILDRIDALLFVAPAVYVALRLGWLALTPAP